MTITCIKVQKTALYLQELNKWVVHPKENDMDRWVELSKCILVIDLDSKKTSLTLVLLPELASAKTISLYRNREDTHRLE